MLLPLLRRDKARLVEKLWNRIWIFCVVGKYYETELLIDRHDRGGQDSFELRMKLRVNGWSLRVNLALLSVVVVDVWLFQYYSVGPWLNIILQSINYSDKSNWKGCETECWVFELAFDWNKNEISFKLIGGIGTLLAVTHKKRKLSNSKSAHPFYLSPCLVFKRNASRSICLANCENRSKDVLIYHMSTKSYCLEVR